MYLPRWAKSLHCREGACSFRYIKILHCLHNDRLNDIALKGRRHAATDGMPPFFLHVLLAELIAKKGASWERSSIYKILSCKKLFTYTKESQNAVKEVTEEIGDFFPEGHFIRLLFRLCIITGKSYIVVSGCFVCCELKKN